MKRAIEMMPVLDDITDFSLDQDTIYKIYPVKYAPSFVVPSFLLVV